MAMILILVKRYRICSTCNWSFRLRRNLCKANSLHKTTLCHMYARQKFPATITSEWNSEITESRWESSGTEDWFSAVAQWEGREQTRAVLPPAPGARLPPQALTWTKSLTPDRPQWRHLGAITGAPRATELPRFIIIFPSHVHMFPCRLSPPSRSLPPRSSPRAFPERGRWHACLELEQ